MTWQKRGYKASHHHPLPETSRDLPEETKNFLETYRKVQCLLEVSRISILVCATTAGLQWNLGSF